MRQAIEPELAEPGPELLEVLAAEQAEDELRRVVLAPAGDEGEDEAGQERLVEDGDRAMPGVRQRLPGTRYWALSRMSS